MAAQRCSLRKGLLAARGEFSPGVAPERSGGDGRAGAGMEAVMARSAIDLDLDIHPRLPRKMDFGIGAIGSGFIMRDCHLVAYNNAGFRTLAIASRTPAHARSVAEQHGIPRVYDTWRELLEDPAIEIVDIAFPPDQQLDIVREAVRHPD